MSTVAVQAAQVEAGIQPFSGNLEYLETKLSEVRMLLQAAAVRRRIQRQHAGHGTGPDGNGDGSGSEPMTHPRGLRSRLARIGREHANLRRRTEERLALSDGVELPAREMAERCGLSPFDQDVLWLLFFKGASPEFRQEYDDSDLNRFGHELLHELYIGNVLQILCPDSLSAQLEATRHFTADAPLLAHHLVRFGRDVQECVSILQVEVQLPQRVAAWIADDLNNYANDRPFLLERPEDRLESVVLPSAQVEQVLDLVSHHEAFVRRRQDLGLERLVTYGRAMAILEYGPPGTGKTLLARALANHTGRPLVMLPDQSEGDLGGSDPQERLSNLFLEAQLQRGIVFIDECEHLCQESSPMLRPLLTELEHTDAIVLMATNRPELLAPALDRRFVLKVEFRVPDAQARERIWGVHLAGVPLAPDVDLAYLAAAYPFAGGYIKNAVLAAVSMNLSRSLDAPFALRQADLLAAAALQAPRTGSGTRGVLTTPGYGVKDSLVPAAARSELERLVRMARGYLNGPRPGRSLERLVPVPDRGLHLLFHGQSFAAAMRGAGAFAGELRMPMTCLAFGRDVGTRGGSEDSRHTSGSWDCQELFAAVARTPHVLLFVDPLGQLTNHGEKAEDTERGFWNQLRSFDGIAVVVTACRKPRLPGWARVFHERVEFDVLDAETQESWWAALLGDRAEGVDLSALSARHSLTGEQIQSAVHRAGLLAGCEGPNALVDGQVLESAIGSLADDADQRGPLF